LLQVNKIWDGRDYFIFYSTVGGPLVAPGYLVFDIDGDEHATG
jgi:hypothetical protein